MSNPYVGITGFMNRTEVKECLTCVPLKGAPTPRDLMVGVLASAKTINGMINTLGNKFPRREQIAKIFVKHPMAFNCIHFATDQPELLYDHLMLCLEYGGGLIDGFQLNIPWPDKDAINRVKKQNGRLKFILQISPHLPEYSKMDFCTIAVELHHRYGDLIDYVIADFSRGLGNSAGLNKTIELLYQLAIQNPRLRLVYGGGLCADNVKEIIGQISQTIPHLSWDAEGQLRDNSREGGHLVLYKAMEYLARSFDIGERSRDAALHS